MAQNTHAHAQTVCGHNDLRDGDVYVYTKH